MGAQLHEACDRQRVGTVYGGAWRREGAVGGGGLAWCSVACGGRVE
jgi:hypothetical protein